ncbi:trimeric LpxA-like protein [Limtongia smithiae]|uniref:trimeric LpxA-like protein n=1 Tax=Limtongia smithiae TaxID=1125753 RepID=UPI0034CDCE02
MAAPRRQTRRNDYIETESGNRISRKAVILGSQHILLGGRSTVLPECVVHGDLRKPTAAGTTGAAAVAVSMGRYTFLEKRVVIRPPFKMYKGSVVYYPLKIGNYVTVGEGSVLESALIGSHVRIGKNCVIGKFAILKDCVVVLDSAVIAASAVIPPLSVVAGNPARVIAELPETAAEVLERRARQLHALHGQELSVDSGEGIRRTVFDDDVDDEFEL